MPTVVAGAGPGAVIHVPACVPHRRIGAGADETLDGAAVRSDIAAVALNREIEPAGQPLGRSPPPGAAAAAPPLPAAAPTRHGARPGRKHVDALLRWEGFRYATTRI